MFIISDFAKDVRTPKPQPGAYEWWYFDAVDHSGRYKFVIIFYEGNPFSPSYIKDIDSNTATADQYPAISISVYDGDTPIYYSFTEFDADDCFFYEEHPELKVGKHLMKGYSTEDQITYELKLDETLPSGDRIESELTFTSGVFSRALFSSKPHEKAGHMWYPIQPGAEVEGTIEIGAESSESTVIDFEGNGYHDHNTGSEPMKEEFVDWYWGRFHFRDYTLIYYLMNQKDTNQYEASLIENKSGLVVERLNKIEITDESLTIFGLKSARKIGIKSESFEIVIQQSKVLDSGPFYQRFESEAFLHDVESGKSESATGISEYIYPDRIYSSIFWPLVNMRIYNKKRGAHWVQKSPMLYRWTW